MLTGNVFYFEIVDGGYGSWTNWTKCSVSCGVGVRTRHRECDSPEPQNGGLSCIEAGLGPEDESAECDMGLCPGKVSHRKFSPYF